MYHLSRPCVHTAQLVELIRFKKVLILLKTFTSSLISVTLLNSAFFKTYVQNVNSGTRKVLEYANAQVRASALKTLSPAFPHRRLPIHTTKVTI